MAHGEWTNDNDIFLVALVMGTKFGWGKIQEEFRRRFGTSTTHRDLESRWNKRLREGDLALAVDDFRHSGVVKENHHQDDILSVVVILAAYSAAERVF